MTVLIVKNISGERSGILERILNDNNIDYETVDASRGEEIPDPKRYSALFVFGGPDSANDASPKMLAELSRIKEAIDANVPYFGVCLGLQTLVKAAGGKVRKNEVSEIGWRSPDRNYFEINPTSEGSSDPIFEGMIPPTKVFHLHGETVDLSDKMTLLATGKYCRSQVVRVGENAYGIQGHFELTPKMFNDWLRNAPDLKKLDSQELKKDYEEIKQEYEQAGKKIFTNFLRIAKLI